MNAARLARGRGPERGVPLADVDGGWGGGMLPGCVGIGVAGVAVGVPPLVSTVWKEIEVSLEA